MDDLPKNVGILITDFVNCNMNPKLIFPVAIMAAMIVGAVNFSSCRKSCYDRALHETHKNDFCTADCPGVTGCDGQFYCNECIANKNGIRVQ